MRTTIVYLHLQYILEQKGNCINIDGGCVYTEEMRAGYGNLVAVILDTMQFVHVANCEKE